eukprot:TRINITY_DN4434_c0_g1_i2.p1 TRINITY_DN4434_c0_g1~~TRINITY_DN4434_c0_g1_i2.p1  ORF type:complete len:917 (+),score=112.81 TRINITY_DN4434_c0_g1_i2:175-2925(+)
MDYSVLTHHPLPHTHPELSTTTRPTAHPPQLSTTASSVLQMVDMCQAASQERIDTAHSSPPTLPTSYSMQAPQLPSPLHMNFGHHAPGPLVVDGSLFSQPSHSRAWGNVEANFVPPALRVKHEADFKLGTSPHESHVPGPLGVLEPQREPIPTQHRGKLTSEIESIEDNWKRKRDELTGGDVTRLTTHPGDKQFGTTKGNTNEDLDIRRLIKRLKTDDGGNPKAEDSPTIHKEDPTSLVDGEERCLRYLSTYRNYLFSFLPVSTEALREETVLATLRQGHARPATPLSLSVYLLLAHGARACEDHRTSLGFFNKSKQHLKILLSAQGYEQADLRLAEGLWGMALFSMGMDDAAHVSAYLDAAMGMCARLGSVNSPCYLRCLHGKFVLSLALDEPKVPKHQENSWLRFKDQFDQAKKAPPLPETPGNSDMPVSSKNLCTLDCILRIVITVVTGTHSLSNEWTARKAGKSPCILDFKSAESFDNLSVPLVSSTDNADMLAAQGKLLNIITRLKDEITQIQSSNEPLPDNVVLMLKLHSVALYAMIYWALDQYDEALRWARQYVQETNNPLFKLVGLGASLQIDIIVNVLEKLHQTALMEELLSSVMNLAHVNKHVGLMQHRIRNAICTVRLLPTSYHSSVRAMPSEHFTSSGGLYPPFVPPRDGTSQPTLSSSPQPPSLSNLELPKPLPSVSSFPSAILASALHPHQAMHSDSGGSSHTQFEPLAFVHKNNFFQTSPSLQNPLSSSSAYMHQSQLPPLTAHLHRQQDNTMRQQQGVYAGSMPTLKSDSPPPLRGSPPLLPRVIKGSSNLFADSCEPLPLPTLVETSNLNNNTRTLPLSMHAAPMLVSVPAILAVDKQCMQCGTRTTPEWRKGPHGPRTLCNACGLRWSRSNQNLKRQLEAQPVSDPQLFTKFTICKKK